MDPVAADSGIHLQILLASHPGVLELVLGQLLHALQQRLSEARRQYICQNQVALEYQCIGKDVEQGFGGPDVGVIHGGSVTEQTRSAIQANGVHITRNVSNRQTNVNNCCQLRALLPLFYL